MPVLAALAVFLGAAGPALPLPPIPPASVLTEPPAIEPAPVPDTAITPPATTAPGSRIRVTPELFRQGRDYQGNGYLPGSTIYRYEERDIPLTPGFTVHIPIR